MVPADSRRISRVLRYSGAVSLSNTVFAYGAFTRSGAPFQALRLTSGYTFIDGPTTPVIAVTMPVWALARSLATTGAIIIIFSSSGY